MRVHRTLVFLLIAGLPVAATAGQRAPSGSLSEAAGAFASALADHDRAAFVAMFAGDAESTLPIVTRGPEAIANAWLPFLIDPGTTMLLTTTDVVMTSDGDEGTSSGTMAIRGRTDSGMRTLSAGTYVITWRLVDGRWKIVTLGSSDTQTRGVDNRAGVGPFQFGMTLDEVSRVRDCEPYTKVAITGGLECPRYRFDGREMNISFLFAADRLRRIQLWYFEGEAIGEAREAVDRVLSFLQRTTGGATITARPDVPLTADGIIGALHQGPSPTGRQIVGVEVAGSAVGSTVWFARVGRHEHGYLVMLFAEAAGGEASKR
jgi:ketosteroid isomerase-like protein